MAEKSYQKNAWVLLFILGIAGILFGLLQLAGQYPDAAQLTHVLGQSPSSFAASNPNAWSALVISGQFTGAFLLGFGIFGLAISYTAYRRGEKWAWYAELYLPISFVIVIDLDYTNGGSLYPLVVVFLLMSLAGLALPYRKFFHR